MDLIKIAIQFDMLLATFGIEQKEVNNFELNAEKSKIEVLFDYKAKSTPKPINFEVIFDRNSYYLREIIIESFDVDYDSEILSRSKVVIDKFVNRFLESIYENATGEQDGTDAITDEIKTVKNRYGGDGSYTVIIK